MSNVKSLLASLFIAVLTACTTAPPAPVTVTAPMTAPEPAAAQPQPPVAGARPCVAGDAILNATLWMESAAEHDAMARQVYSLAHRMLDAALADSSWSAMPAQTSAAGLAPAIILDLDETAIDNMGFESRVIREGKTYSQDVWNDWVAQSAATAIPGAAEFLNYAKSRGVTPFYITNRETKEKAATRANLEKLGFPLEADGSNLITRGDRPDWTASDKTPRREFVASNHRVLLLLGDDLNDFTFAAGKSREERDALVRQYADNWGVKWLILSNPVYGSWERATLNGATGADDCEKKLGKLR